jgi:hypothetical protein
VKRAETAVRTERVERAERGAPRQIEAAATAVRERLGDRRPKVAVVLGSGLGFLAD